MSATKLKASLCVLSVLTGTMLAISAAPANAALAKNSKMLCSFQQSQSHEDKHIYFEIYYGDYCAVYRVAAALRGVSSAEFGHFELTGPNGYHQNAGKPGGCNETESRFNDGDGVDCTLPNQHGSLNESWCARFWQHNADGTYEVAAGETCVRAGR
jgi:hypothetical protein